MANFAVGDIVARKSYSVDVFFKIVDIYYNEAGEKVALLKGLDVRLCADAPISDLTKFSVDQVRSKREEFIDQNKQLFRQLFLRHRHNSLQRSEITTGTEFYNLPGKVLHLDGDEAYLNLCMKSYKDLKIHAQGYNIAESNQAKQVQALLEQHSPDILVLTGHDGLIKGKSDFKNLDSYRNSKFYVEAVKVARKFDRFKDSLIIFAGACQSHYEAILQAGANFASSPKRILIHAFDPVFIVEKLAYTPFDQTVSMEEVIKGTVSGFEGVGGIETRGKLRLGLPKSPY